MKNINPADKRVRVLTTNVDHANGVKTVTYVSIDPTISRMAVIQHFKGEPGWTLNTDGADQPDDLVGAKKADAVRCAAAWVADGVKPHED